MFLTRHQHATPEQEEALREIAKDDPRVFAPVKATVISDNIGYWRKANHIHGWFVDNVQNGEDDCQEHLVSREDLQKLQKSVEAVLNASKLVQGKVSAGYTLDENGERKYSMVNGLVIEDATCAKLLLPRQRGFFFGGEEYDEGYVEDLRDTLKIIDIAVSSPATAWFTYQSSW